VLFLLFGRSCFATGQWWVTDLLVFVEDWSLRWRWPSWWWWWGGGSALRFGNLVGATVKKVILEGVIDCIAPSATPMVEGGGVYLSER
jgi:hypothetical protein